MLSMPPNVISLELREMAAWFWITRSAAWPTHEFSRSSDAGRPGSPVLYSEAPRDNTRRLAAEPSVGLARS
jgi:hypothetical protein